MKISTKIGIGVGVLIATPLIVALFIKKDYAVEREITINKPKLEVFDYIKNLKNQEHYSKWAMMDPGMKRTYVGIDGTVGFIASWESKNEDVGVGEQEIMKVIEGDSLVSKLRFKEPFSAEDDAYMVTEKVSPTVTRVKWGFKGSFSYPMNLMNLCIDMDKQVGKDLEIGLQNLKQELEKKGAIVEELERVKQLLNQNLKNNNKEMAREEIENKIAELESKLIGNQN